MPTEAGVRLSPYPMAGHRYLVTIADDTQIVEVTLVEPASSEIDDDLVTFKDRQGRLFQVTAQAFVRVLGSTPAGVCLVTET